MRDDFIRLFRPLSVVALCLIFGSMEWNARGGQIPQTAANPLTNPDVTDMLKAGLPPEIVIAKINASACQFDTSPTTLKSLKAANIPDAVILAMINAPSALVAQSKTPEASSPARVECSHADPVPVFSAPRNQANSDVAFKVKCGDKITIIGSHEMQSWLKMQTADGQVGYISWGVVSFLPSDPALAEPAVAKSSRDKQEAAQKAADDQEDCRTRAQNEYDTKMQLVSTLSLTPVQRVYASSRLKQNFDAEIRSCRSLYESRLKSLEGE